MSSTVHSLTTLSSIILDSAVPKMTKSGEKENDNEGKNWRTYFRMNTVHSRITS